MRHVAAAVLSLLLCGPALAGPVKLKPAEPQPAAPGPGLSVAYAYPEQKIHSLTEAATALRGAVRDGKPLRGLDYADTTEGEVTLTSRQAMNVAARITGFVRFDAPGAYDIEFVVNDGIDARIGGQQVGFYDGIQACEGTTVVPVEVPVAGWYPVDILYFQKQGTACLNMKWGPADGKRSWTPNSAFGR